MYKWKSMQAITILKKTVNYNYVFINWQSKNWNSLLGTGDNIEDIVWVEKVSEVENVEDRVDTSTELSLVKNDLERTSIYRIKSKDS